MIDSDTVGPVKVDLGACECPLPDGVILHPEGDYALIARHAPYQMGLAALESVAQATEPVELGVNLRVIYVEWGVVGWNLVDEKGAPRTVSRENIRTYLMNGWSQRTIDLVEACALKFNDEVMLPLQERALRQSNSGPTTLPTSQSRASRRGREKHSPQSSPTSSADGNTYAGQVD